MPLLSQISPSASSFNPDLITIRSTNYNRTIQSVAGFLSTLLPDVLNIPISYYINHKDEFMLGSLKHLVPHDIDEEPKKFWSNIVSKTSREGGCPRAEHLLSQMQSEVISTISSISKDLGILCYQPNHAG